MKMTKDSFDSICLHGSLCPLWQFEPARVKPSQLGCKGK